MSTARNIALQALRSLDSTLKFEDWENGDGEEIGAQLREAVAALEAETGEPVAWRIWSPDGANVYQYTEDGDGEPLYTAPPPAVPQPYAWTVSASGRMWFGKFAEHDARIEATHCGGTVAAFPLYTVPAEPVAWCGVSKSTLPVYRGDE